MENSNNRLINNFRDIVVAGTSFLIYTCMTVPISDNSKFIAIVNLAMLACIALGVISNAIDIRKKDTFVFFLTFLYFVFRVISYRINNIPITYGGSFMIQVFFLVGICNALIKTERQKQIALGSFVVFDIAVLFLCFFCVRFMKDFSERVFVEYFYDGITHKCILFQNPNYAGMISGATIVICVAWMLNDKKSKKRTAVAMPIIVLNAYMLFISTGCRSAETGVIVVFLLYAIICLFKKTDSIRNVVCAILIMCVLTLIPLYALVYHGDNENSLKNVSPLEQILDKASSGRYEIWKTTILSQEGNLLFGYGGHTRAADKREEFVKSFDPNKVDDSYYESTNFRRQHNGYIATLNEAGLTGLVALVLIMLKRAWRLKIRFSDQNWEYLLLPYIFWINLFEAKLLNAMFFTGFLIMVMLMPYNEYETR